MTANFQNCENCTQHISSVTADNDDDNDVDDKPRRLKKCFFFGCKKQICVDEEECTSRRGCEVCGQTYCFDHTRGCEMCDLTFCRSCRRFDRDSEHQMCNECYKRESHNLEPKTKLPDSEDEAFESLYGKQAVDDAIELSETLHRIYADETLEDHERRRRLFNIIVREFQPCLSEQERKNENRCEPDCSNIDRHGKLIVPPRQPNKRSRTESSQNDDELPTAETK